jgi:glycogen synthase
MPKPSSNSPDTAVANKPALRVLMLTWEYPPRVVGGLARHAGELSLALAKSGVEVEVITANTPGAPGVEQLWPKRNSDKPGRLVVHRALPEAIHPIDFISSIHQLNFALLQQYLAMGQKFDLVHAHDWLVGQAAWTLKQGLGLPLVGTIHATEKGRHHGIFNPLQSYINAQEWLLTYEAEKVICCSQFMAEELEGELKVPREKIRVIPNGVEVDRLKVPARLKAGLAEFRTWWAGEQEKIVLFVGRMVREKGADVLIEAMPRVIAGWPNVKFVLVGGGSSQHLWARAHASGVGDRLHIPGYVSEEDLVRLYGVADVAVFPSLYEPFGIVALEAMATGVPVITSDIGGFKEVVRSGENGLHTWANNADSLAWGILEVLRNPQAAQARAARAEKEVRKDFTWEKIAAQTRTVYQAVLPAKKRK